MAKENVSLSVVRRLPRYHRFLKELLASGTVRISSSDLSAKMGLTASQIRQDLNCFGGFGQQGYGYNVKDLYEEIGKILGLDKRRKAVLLGAGNLGRAIALHMDFSSRGFELLAIFDSNPALVGMDVGGVTVSDCANLEAFCRMIRPDVAILCIPKEVARSLAGTLVDCGIRGFWNFSHYDMTLDYPGIAVENVHLGDSLSTLCFRVNELEKSKENPV